MRTELLPDRDRPRAWTLMLDGIPHSHVDLDDPGYLEFEYVRRLGHLADTLPPGPLRVLHLGAGALTLARYIAVRRPGSDQLAIEIDAGLAGLVRDRLPLPRPGRRGRIRIRIGDAREQLGTLRPGQFDLVVADVFADGRTPAACTSAGFAAEAAAVLRGPGILALNVADGPPLAHAKAQAATIASVLPHQCLIADPGVLRGRRFGNLILAASGGPLPVAALTRAAAADPAPGRVLDGAELGRFTAGARPVTDAAARPSPSPPSGLFR